MPQLFTNNARSTLTSTISDSATSLTVQAGAADLFPTANVGTGSIPSASNWFKATLQDVSGNVEIIYVRTRTAGSAVLSNILRAQEGTTARSFVSGSIVGLRVTAADIQASINIPAANNTFTGSNTFAQTITGNLTGNVTGNLTGNVTGNVTGDVTGKLLTAGFTIEESGGKLLFKNGSTTIASLSSTGVLTTLDSVVSHGTP